MDEPTSSLFDDAVERLFHLIRGLRDRGVSIVYVSHKMDEIFRIADRVTVMRDGQTIGTREGASTDTGELIRLMVGRELNLTGGPPVGPPGKALLQVEDLRTARLRGVSFALHRNEVLGVAGLVGAGRSELGAALFGLDRILGGPHPPRRRALHPAIASRCHAARRRPGPGGPPRGRAHDEHERARKHELRIARYGPSPGPSEQCPRTCRARRGGTPSDAELCVPRLVREPSQRRQPTEGAARAVAATPTHRPCSWTIPHAASMSAPSRTSIASSMNWRLPARR